ncbi:MAG: DUF58 domain-containing protein, partial [Chloroflexi bacterium]|nr:DUF58 domain-containing protein [Chloroflexota bacterium]
MAQAGGRDASAIQPALEAAADAARARLRNEGSGEVSPERPDRETGSPLDALRARLRALGGTLAGALGAAASPPFRAAPAARRGGGRSRS